MNPDKPKNIPPRKNARMQFQYLHAQKYRLSWIVRTLCERWNCTPEDVADVRYDRQPGRPRKGKEPAKTPEQIAAYRAKLVRKGQLREDCEAVAHLTGEILAANVTRLMEKFKATELEVNQMLDSLQVKGELTPEQIKAACAAIRAKWSPRVKQWRSGHIPAHVETRKYTHSHSPNGPVFSEAAI